MFLTIAKSDTSFRSMQRERGAQSAVEQWYHRRQQRCEFWSFLRPSCKCHCGLSDTKNTSLLMFVLLYILNVCFCYLSHCYSLAISMGQIIKSLASVCLIECVRRRSYGRTFLFDFHEILHSASGPKGKIKCVWGNNPIAPSLVLPQFLSP